MLLALNIKDLAKIMVVTVNVLALLADEDKGRFLPREQDFPRAAE